MSKTLHFRLGPALVLVVGPVVYLLSRYLELPVGVVVLVAAIALLANGVVASVEDDLPGGFNNPRGGERSSYLRWLRVALALVLLLFAVGFIQAFVLVGNGAPVLFYSGCALACGLVAVGLMTRLAWLQWPALFVLLLGFGFELGLR